tara:strand:- start:550 stop:1917 length:1368 start_codon:yes stop_codon:yes gene_type:complete
MLFKKALRPAKKYIPLANAITPLKKATYCFLFSLYRPLSSVFCLLLTVFCLLFPSLSVAEEKPIGKIIAIIGTVEFLPAGLEESAAKGPDGKIKPVSIPPVWEKAKFHQPVYATDKFRTSQGSRLKIVFEDNSLIALGPNSRMKVESYIYKPKQKLRKAVINAAHGLSMYIVNKSQNHKKSSFNLLSSTGNIAIRGTQGYVSVNPSATLLANQAGSVVASSNDPNVKGKQSVGRMMKTIIAKGKPPLKPVALTNNELRQIRNVIVGGIGVSAGASQGEKPLIEVEEEEKEEEEEEEEAEAEGEAEAESTEGDEEVAESEEESEKSEDEKSEEGTEETETAEGDEAGTEGEKAEDAGQGSDESGEVVAESETVTAKVTVEPGSSETSVSVEISGDAGGLIDVTVAGDIGQVVSLVADLGMSFTDSFVQDVTGFGVAADFTPVNNPFDASILTGCSP